ncbi:MAG: phosphoribosylglycinamide formyltransferase [Eubacteriales bacterium]|nr:phosphoribosylglycinamide formyltransferase [Christensenellaceae bacterium]MEA5066031.1 phosphoribosylglycinamide formyltransferase [Eubacteriales bacterium]
MKARVAVLVSGGGTNLQALIDAQASGILQSGEIALVISSRADAYALTRARHAGIEALTVTRADGEQALVIALDERGIDLVVLAGYLTILGAELVRRYENRIVNVHPSLIPAFSGKGYYGLKPHEEALKRGVKLTGATVHLVNEVPDGGAILAQKAVDVLPGDTPEMLQRRVMTEAEWVLLPRAVESLCLGIVKEKLP